MSLFDEHLFCFFSSVHVYSWSYSMSVFVSSSFAENIQMPNSWERDPNLSLRGKRRKKTLFFCIFLEMQGAQVDENFTVLGVTQSKNEDITLCRASGAR